MEKQSYSSTDLFSNCMTGESAGKKNENTILPGKVEVWSLYKNWSPEIWFSDKCLPWEFLCTELLRFSHQIPAFRLTEERGGSLGCFWELDHPALPVYYFALN
ncbi:hypothetical protein NC653_021798 [Populus alba x Populus x berolinensis]|uniref:DUF3444 domain-containing protein n=1 Tax=Populus alba x Populus x berolinensis TaxID=444605 RepID=A0AAD6MNX7_9ROSI|nr:hypothetical protein NC653_021798 [Populus alba x Populus x berolinensis]